MTIDEIKAKFESLQKEHQRLREEKVKHEAQLNTLQKQYDEQLKQLLTETNTTTLDEAVLYIKKKQEEIAQLTTQLEEELNSYTPTTSPTPTSSLGSLFEG